MGEVGHHLFGVKLGPESCLGGPLQRLPPSAVGCQFLHGFSHRLGVQAVDATPHPVLPDGPGDAGVLRSMEQHRPAGRQVGFELVGEGELDMAAFFRLEPVRQIAEIGLRRSPGASLPPAASPGLRPQRRGDGRELPLPKMRTLICGSRPEPFNRATAARNASQASRP